MEDRIWTCMVRRLSGTETADSSTFLDEWLSSDASHLQKYKEAKALWELSAMIPAQAAQPAVIRSKPRSPFLKYAMAASIAGLLLSTVFYFFNSNVRDHKTEWMVYKTKAAELNKLRLPDGSVVWLNSDSEIRLAKDFTHIDKRVVHLKGEAYFDVKHDKKHPFVVISDSLTTTVYGTSFSVRAYGNETESAVAVNSGKVGVQSARASEPAVLLLPNDKIRLKQGRLIRTQIDNRDVDSWINGELVFEQTPIPEVLATIARKYNVKIHAEQNNYRDCKLTARFQNKPLQAILKTLHLSMNITSKTVGQTIYLKGGDCM